VLFLVDNTATVVTDQMIASLPLRYFALGGDRPLHNHINELRQEEAQKCQEIYDSGAGTTTAVFKKTNG
jgi:hypothetical protein